MNKVDIFCDGSCLGNPGPGGWGTIIRPENMPEIRISGGAKLTTNNMMELMAAIEGLKKIKKLSHITITTDSQYLVKGMTEWIDGWIRKGWRNSAKKPVKNRELWEDLKKFSAPHKVEWKWVRGHAGHAENELCDQMAVEKAYRFKTDTTL